MSVTTAARRYATPVMRPLIRSQSRQSSSGASKRVSLLEADDGKLGTKIYWTSGILSLVALPAAFALSPSPFVKPVDAVLAFALPLHAHVGMNYVISDYIPKSRRPVARAAMLAATGIATLGLLKLVPGPGITSVVKATWAKPSLPTSEVDEKTSPVPPSS